MLAIITRSIIVGILCGICYTTGYKIGYKKGYARGLKKGYSQYIDKSKSVNVIAQEHCPVIVSAKKEIPQYEMHAMPNGELQLVVFRELAEKMGLQMFEDGLISVEMHHNDMLHTDNCELRAIVYPPGGIHPFALHDRRCSNGKE